MNELWHHQITIDFDIWSAHEKQAWFEIDELIKALNEKKSLNHCGNVKAVNREISRHVVE